MIIDGKVCDRLDSTAILQEQNGINYYMYQYILIIKVKFYFGQR